MQAVRPSQSAKVVLGTPVLAETHEVRMFNRSDRGVMVYEPSFLRIAPGDTVRFVPTQPGHNAASIDGMIPEGAKPFKSRINEDFSVTLTVPGSYGIKCSPHFAMGMVMLIEVGEAPAPALPDDLPPKSRARFDEILARRTPGAPPPPHEKG
ncbi:pseudoazurin [uncultured Paracoccus sp.]|uniref:pseudoazurin n=1 Tax=uncultured Paracoccus sp. TaxID=189685 RepID=UPI0025990093|nr:pseudoazurin [uncultured Paracoccus sp.]